VVKIRMENIEAMELERRVEGRHPPPIEVDEFDARGYLVFPRLLDDEFCVTLRGEIDRFVEGRMELAVLLPGHADLVTHPHVLAVVAQLMRGREFGFHHLHTARHDFGTEALCWHHDYEQLPQSSRVNTMVHVFIYPNGLNGTVGDLLLLPGSHQTVCTRDAWSRFGSEILPGAVVIDDLPAGSVVAIHSAVQHARRAKPGGETDPRYFIDISYCQDGEVWPAYKERGDWRQILKLLRERDHGGQFHSLFRESYFREGEDRD